MTVSGAKKIEGLDQNVVLPDGTADRSDVRNDVVSDLKEEPNVPDKSKDSVLVTVEDLMSKDPELKIETVKDLRELSVEVLMKLENKYEGVLMYAFTSVVDATDIIDFGNWKEYTAPVAGQKIKIDFRDNKDAESFVGAADIFPPSIRKVTVYEHGDMGAGRTSERRIGLKGQNIDGRGFFDSLGYIPVYSGDIIIVGGADNPSGGVDLDFDKKFRSKDEQGNDLGLDAKAYENYEQSEDGAADKTFITELLKKRPNARMKKVWTNDEIDNLINSVEADGVAQRVIEAVGSIVKERYNPAHCWDWVNKVYQRAGVRGRHIVFRSLNYVGKDCGDNHASPEMLDKIRPGDWLFYNNKNTADSQGNHSALFIKWIDETNRIAQFASGYYNHPGRFHTANLIEKPVVLIKKPTA